MTRFLVPAFLILFLAACSTERPSEATGAASDTPGPSLSVSTPTSEPSVTGKAEPGEQQVLRDAVTAYSDAFLDADVAAAYRILSRQCRNKYSLSYFTGVATAFSDTYGRALPIKTFEANISGDTATVSYTYDVPALDQINEPWVLEGQQWRNDDC